jgi:hypothetical protein
LCFYFYNLKGSIKGHSVVFEYSQRFYIEDYTLFVWLLSHQPAVLFSHNKSAISNQPAVLFSQHKPAPAISHQPNEQADLNSTVDSHFRSIAKKKE